MKLSILFAVTIFLPWTHAVAQSIEQFVRVEAPPTWVEVQAVPEGIFEPATELDIAYKLVDRQKRITGNRYERYYHFIDQLNTPAGVEEHSTLSIGFDPSYQKVVIHHILVIRDGETIKRFNLSDLDMYRVETDRGRLIYNKDLQISYIIPDVRVGDVLDYAYSINGHNPALKNQFTVQIQQQYSVPVQQIHNRTLVSDDFQVTEKSHAGAAAPNTRLYEGYKEIVWEGKNIPSLSIDDNRPSWYYAYPTYQLSSFEDWRHVGKVFAPYYAVNQPSLPEVQRIAADITAQHSNQEGRVRAALDFVQREIRYLGIEMGSGGYIPRNPKEVLESRFGDCKDMTLLLLSILSAMEIEASALLVDGDYLAGIEFFIPTYAVFDHVVAHVEIEGRQYILDATRGQQLGSLQTMAQGVFEKGLLLSARAPDLIDLKPETEDWRKEIIDTFDLITLPSTVLYTSELNYFADQADAMKSWLQQDGHEALEKSFLEYDQDYYPTLKTKSPMVISIDEDQAKFTVKLSYEIEDAWEDYPDEGLRRFKARPYEVSADFPAFVGASRVSPFAIDYPEKTRQVIVFKVDDSWSFEDEEFRIDNSGFSYSKITSHTSNMYKEEYEYLAKLDHLPANQFEDIMESVSDARNGMSVTMQENVGQSAPDPESRIEAFIYIWFVIAAIIALLFSLRISPKEDAWREKGILYPVRTDKFLILSFATLGLYQIYWIFKNWLWIKTVQKDNVPPRVAAFFAGFSNFALFPRISRLEPAGYSWFKHWAIPLAVLFLLGNILERVVMRTDNLPEWVTVVSFASLIILLPVAIQVLKMNHGKEDVIENNSRFDMPAIGLIVLFLPVSLLTVSGCLIILRDLIFS